MEYGKKIRVLRAEHDLTQGQLAHKAGITQAMVSKVESGGNATIEVLSKIADAFNCDLEILFNPIVYVVDPVSEEIKQA